MNLSRRDLLLKTLFGTGLLGLRSLATGLPLSFLLDPRRAMAQPGSPSNAAAQYVIFNTSGRGDPINVNAPGMYEASGIVHPGDSAMAKTSLTLAGTSTHAAAPWATLPQAVLDRSCFFNHGTYTVVHPDESNVLQLMGSLFNQEMLPSLLAKQLAPQLGTIQTEPVALGLETIKFNGRAQPNLAPVALAETLMAPTGPLLQLQGLRDKYLDEINATVRSQGNSAQQAFIDRYVISQQQVREVSQQLLSTLATLKDNSQDSQAIAAVVLIQMNVAPVITMHIAFGDDNHTDVGFVTETSQTVAGVATIGNLMQQLTAAGIQDRVSFVSLNVFGRTLTTTGGRDHHGDHHCAVLIGKPFKGGIVGGVELNAKQTDYIATSIDSSSGASVPGGGGDVPFGSTLTSMAKTVCTAVGVAPSYLDNNITGGQLIQGALSGA